MIQTWIQALRIIPRVDREEWKKLDVVSKWLIATRSAVFLMTALSAGLGGVLAWRDRLFNWFPFLLSLTGLVFAHAANNLLNDYVDYKKGIDVSNYYRTQYGPQTVQAGYFTRREFAAYLGVSGLIAFACGLILVLTTPNWTLLFFAAGAFFLLFYTWPLKYIGLGEPTVLLVWGPLMVGGTYYVVTGGVLSLEVMLISLIYALGPTTVLFGKHIDKRSQDLEKGVLTLPVILGEKAARYTTVVLWIFQYILSAAAIWLRFLHPVLAVVLLAVPGFIRVCRVFSKPKPESEPPDMPPNVWPLYLSAHAFVYNKRFGGLFVLGVMLDVILKKLGLL